MKKCAVVGMGLLGKQHASYLNSYENTEVIAVCDIKVGKAKEWALSNNASYYDNHIDLLNNEIVDLIVVATQDPYHKSVVLDACRANVPFIICEKPLTTSVSDALEIKEAVAKSRSILKVLFPNRLYPIDNSIRSILRQGLIGAPEYGEFRIDDSINVPLNLWGQDSKNFAVISSPAYFLLSHAVDLIHYFFDSRIVKVYAIGKQSVIGSEFDFIDCFLTFNSGFVFRLKTEWTKRIDQLCENYIQLTASKGGFIFNKTGGFNCKQGLSIVFDDKENALKAKAIADGKNQTSNLIKSSNSERFELTMFEKDNGNGFDWNDGVRIYADSFTSDTSKDFPLTNLNMGIEQVIVVEAIIKSARSNKEIII